MSKTFKKSLKSLLDEIICNEKSGFFVKIFEICKQQSNYHAFHLIFLEKMQIYYKKLMIFT